jgi:hypothetical protein
VTLATCGSVGLALTLCALAPPLAAVVIVLLVRA